MFCSEPVLRERFGGEDGCVGCQTEKEKTMKPTKVDVVLKWVLVVVVSIAGLTRRFDIATFAMTVLIWGRVQGRI